MVIVGVAGIVIGLYTLVFSRRIAIQARERLGLSYGDRAVAVHQAFNVLTGVGVVVIGVLVLAGQYP